MSPELCHGSLNSLVERFSLRPQLHIGYLVCDIPTWIGWKPILTSKRRRTYTMASALLSYNDNGCTRAYKYLLKTKLHYLSSSITLDQAGYIPTYPCPLLSPSTSASFTHWPNWFSFTQWNAMWPKSMGRQNTSPQIASAVPLFWREPTWERFLCSVHVCVSLREGAVWECAKLQCMQVESFKWLF